MIYVFSVCSLIPTDAFESSITNGENGTLFDGCYKLDRFKTLSPSSSTFSEEVLYRYLGISKYDNQLNNVIRSIAGLSGRNIVLSSSVDDMMPNIMAVVAYDRDLMVELLSNVFTGIKLNQITKAVDKYHSMINRVRYRSKHYISHKIVDDISDIIELSLDASRVVRVNGTSEYQQIQN
jgi:hypothetical protein